MPDAHVCGRHEICLKWLKPHSGNMVGFAAGTQAPSGAFLQAWTMQCSVTKLPQCTAHFALSHGMSELFEAAYFLAW